MRILSALVLLTACSEVGLSPFDPDDPDVVDPVDDPDPERPDSPWDDVTPGNLPDVNFVVLWHDVTGVVAVDEANDRYPCRPGGQTWRQVFEGTSRLSLVDVRGRVIGDIPLPVELGHDGEAAELEPLGDQRFLLRARSAQAERYVWEIDAATAEVTEVLRWIPSENSDELHVLGEPMPLPLVFSDVHATLLDGALYVAFETPGGSPPPADSPRLLRIAPDTHTIEGSWSIDDLIPEHVTNPTTRLELRGLRATGRRLILDALHQSSSWTSDDASQAHRWYRFVYDPDLDTHSWIVDIDWWDTSVFPMVVREDAVRATLLAEFDPPVRPMHLLRTSGGDVDLGSVPCGRPGTILDTVSPTVVLLDHPQSGPDDYGTSLVIHHAGREVLRHDTLKVGLAERRAFIQSMALLE